MVWKANPSENQGKPPSTEFELKPDAIEARSALASRVIPRNQVRKVKNVPDGLQVHGATLTDRLVVRKELEGYEQLAAVRSWAPEGTARTSGGISVQLQLLGYLCPADWFVFRGESLDCRSVLSGKVVSASPCFADRRTPCAGLPTQSLTKHHLPASICTSTS